MIRGLECVHAITLMSKIAIWWDADQKSVTFDPLQSIGPPCEYLEARLPLILATHSRVPRLWPSKEAMNSRSVVFGEGTSYGEAQVLAGRCRRRRCTTGL